MSNTHTRLYAIRLDTTHGLNMNQPDDPSNQTSQATLKYLDLLENVIKAATDAHNRHAQLEYMRLTLKLRKDQQFENELNQRENDLKKQQRLNARALSQIQEKNMRISELQEVLRTKTIAKV